MVKISKFDKKNLKKRYLVWFYKTLKEEVDKVERKFTQVEVDEFVLEDIKKESKKFSQSIEKQIEGFEKYIQSKEKSGNQLKFNGKKLKSEYLFLLLKLNAVEKAIVKELGKSALSEIKEIYEREMTNRILESRGH